jgi:HSP20 family protein
MDMRDLIPWGRNRSLPASTQSESGNPFLALWNGWSGGWPHVEVNETADDVRIVAELPGLDAKDVEVTLQDGVLTLKGEKKAENQSAFYSERWQGRFQRSMQLGPDVDPDKVNAGFKNGVLTITAAKRPEAQRQTKRIPITGG